MAASGYECSVHNIQHEGIKREQFQTEFYSAILNVSMYTSMKLYKSINVNCHCPSNYEHFDALVKADTDPVSVYKDPKQKKD